MNSNSKMIPVSELKMSGIQKCFLAANKWEGTECCPYCDMETDFSDFSPLNSTYIKCSNCGEEILPCSLCDASICSSDDSLCQKMIQLVLLRENDMIQEE